MSYISIINSVIRDIIMEGRPGDENLWDKIKNIFR